MMLEDFIRPDDACASRLNLGVSSRACNLGLSPHDAGAEIETESKRLLRSQCIEDENAESRMNTTPTQNLM